MREFLLLLLCLTISLNKSYCYELISPINKKATVNTNYAFFYGQANESEQLYINDEKIYHAPNGAFAHSVKLKDGENRIILKSNYNSTIYKITKTIKQPQTEQNLVEFAPRLYKVTNDNTPLRSTPIDYGMNRLSHLFKDTNIIINGEKGNFYRVLLSANKEAWISKNSVCESCEIIYPGFININTENYKNATKHIIEFTEKLPYTIEETDYEIIFKVYNPIVSKDSVYTINLKKPSKYTYETKLQGNSYIFKISELPTQDYENFENINIVIDAGHGGSEKGAIGCLGDEEKNINLSIAKELQKELQEIGINALLTRDCDEYVSLENRIKFARENCSNIFISIHLNSIPDIKMDVNKNRGTSVYYYNLNSKDLASSILNSITTNIKTKKEGIKTASFAVIRPTEYIGVLIEAAYMTNPNDTVIYTNPNFSTSIAKSIKAGILNFLCNTK